VDFEILGEIREIATIAAGRSVRESKKLRRVYGGRRWRKRRGVARVRLVDDGSVHLAEIHWYEAHGIGKVDAKIKRLID
jgi:hypothetical protein